MTPSGSERCVRASTANKKESNGDRAIFNYENGAIFDLVAVYPDALELLSRSAACDRNARIFMGRCEISSCKHLLQLEKRFRMTSFCALFEVPTGIADYSRVWVWTEVEGKAQLSKLGPMKATSRLRHEDLVVPTILIEQSCRSSSPK